MPTIEVVVDAPLAAELGDDRAADTELGVLAGELGAELAARNYVEADGLPHHWYLEVVDDHRVHEVLDRLRDVRGVEAAYVKPSDALP